MVYCSGLLMDSLWVFFFLGRYEKESLYIARFSISLWRERWFLSSNAKDIGTLIRIFALFAGLVGTAFSVLIRLELSDPGIQFIADNQLYNSIISLWRERWFLSSNAKDIGLILSFISWLRLFNFILF